MKFKDLYAQSKKQIKEAIIGMWREVAPSMIENYGEQLDSIVSQCISDNIVVENMARWTSVEDDNWKQVINPNIWRRYKKDENGNVTNEIEAIPYPPYKHQYESWKALMGENNINSIVVTSGTGSGKTE